MDLLPKKETLRSSPRLQSQLLSSMISLEEDLMARLSSTTLNVIEPTNNSRVSASPTNLTLLPQSPLLIVRVIISQSGRKQLLSKESQKSLRARVSKSVDKTLSSIAPFYSGDTESTQLTWKIQWSLSKP